MPGNPNAKTFDQGQPLTTTFIDANGQVTGQQTLPDTSQAAAGDDTVTGADTVADTSGFLAAATGVEPDTSSSSGSGGGLLDSLKQNLGLNDPSSLLGGLSAQLGALATPALIVGGVVVGLVALVAVGYVLNAIRPFVKGGG